MQRLLGIYFCLSCFFVFGQSKNRGIGEALYLKGYYAEAIPYLKSSYQAFQQAYTAHCLGQAYVQLGEYPQAKVWLIKALAKTPNDTLLIAHYAQLLMRQDQYILAKSYWEKYAQLKKVTNCPMLAVCDSALCWQQAKTAFTLTLLAHANSLYSEISPFVVGDDLFFASTRPSTVIEQKNPATGEGYYDIFIARSSAKKGKGKPKQYSVLINGPLHETSCMMDSALTEIYFTKTIQDSSGQAIQNIFKSEKTLLGWNTPHHFYLNDSAIAAGHPFVSSDGKIFLFSSTKAGGYGGADIYIAYKKGDGWSVPENLGSGINTAGNEYFPSIQKDGTILFSSNGHFSIGGYDLFSSMFNGTGWDKAINLKPPFNSGADDFGLFFEAKSKTYYLSSNRPGGKGKEDLYSIQLKP